MKTHIRFGVIAISMMIFGATFASASQTFSRAANAFAKAHSQNIAFQSQSGNYGIVITAGAEEGGIEAFGYTTSCSCWKTIGGGGGIVEIASDLQSFFGIDSVDANVLAAKLKVFEATKK